MRFATARDILTASRYRKSLQIDGIEKPVEIVGLTQSGVMALQEISKRDNGLSQINAWLIKQCCPAFRWWSMAKIHRTLPVPVVVDLVREIMLFSGIGGKALDAAEKKSASIPSSGSSSS